MKIAFFGTGDFSKNILKKLLKFDEIEIKLVVSQNDKYIGRKKILTKTPVRILAEENNIKVLQPTKLKNNIDFFNELIGLDFIIVVAYGKIVPKEVIDAPKYGCINIHGSILPKYRGASPIQEAIKNGDIETGLTIMYMSEAMDEGGILKIEKVKIDKIDKTPDIFNKFENIGTELLVNTLKEVKNGNINSIKQEEKNASYCSKITKQDGEIDFKNQNAENIYNKFRAYYPWPGIYSYYNGKKLNIEDCDFNNMGEFEKNYNGDLLPGKVIKLDKNNFGVVCKDQKFLILKKIKLEGKKTMDINIFINGNTDFINYYF